MDGRGQIANGTQTNQAFALNMGLLPAEEYRAASERLVEQIVEKHNGHLSTGTVGTKHLLNALDKIERNDIAYTIVNQKAYPGWGYMLENGATSLWESWSGSDNVYSNCHPAFGSVNEWFFKSVTGIRPDPKAVGFNRIIIKPEITGNLTWAYGKYKSVHGLIVSDWRIKDGKLLLQVKVPVNTTARVFLPAMNVENITESNVPVAKAQGVKFIGMEKEDLAEFFLESGRYSFTSVID